MLHKLTLKENTLLQYSILTMVIITVTTFTLTTFLSIYTTDYLIYSHIELYPDIVQAMVKNNSEIEQYFNRSPELTGVASAPRLFESLLSLGVVFRIKVWNREGVILWSDEKSIIGQSFADNPSFKTAMNNQISYSIELPDNQENMLELDRGKIIEIYTPVQTEDKVIGVIEIYESNKELLDKISTLKIFITATIIIFGIILYLIQFLIFYNSYKNQKLSNYQLQQTKEVTLFSLAALAETRDNETGRHLERTAAYVELIAAELKMDKKYNSYFTKEYIKDLVASAPLHDIGKVGVPDAILLKPGKLTTEEFEIMKQHSEIGAQTLIEAEKKLDFRSFLTIAIQICRYHHEKWNGKGYPAGLKGENIPISARIMALADVYDALRSRRAYKGPFSHEKSRDIITEERGRHFDPMIVDIFLKQEKKFYEISLLE